MKVDLKRFSRFRFLFIGLALVYGFLAPKGMTGIADSDEIITLASQFKAIHPPGYPVMTTLYLLAVRLNPLTLPVFLKMNWFNAVIMAAAVCVWGGSLMELTKTVTKPNFKKWGKGFILLMTAALGLTLPYLIYGAVTEVMALQLLGTFLTLTYAIRLDRTHKDKIWIILVVLASITFLHQQLSWLILPTVLILSFGYLKELFLRRKWRPLLISIITVGLVMGVNYFLLNTQLKQKEGWHWQSGTAKASVWNYWTRKIYQGTNVELGTELYSYLTPNFIFGLAPNFLNYLGQFVAREITWLGIMLSLFGVGVSYRYLPRRVWLSIVLAGLLTGPALGAYINFGPETQTKILAERMWLTGLAFFMYFLAFGFKGLMAHKAMKPYQYWGWGLLLLVIGFRGLVNIREVKAITSGLWEAAMTRNLELLPHDARVICLSDISCFSLMAWQEAYRQGKDVTVVPVTPYLKTLTDLNLTWGNYPDNPFRLDLALGSSAVTIKPIFAFELDDFYRKHWLINQGGYRVNQAGWIKELTCGNQTTVTTDNFPRVWFEGDNLISLLRNEWVLNQLKPEIADRPCTDATENFKASQKCFEEKKMECALRESLSAVQKNPEKWEYRWLWAEVLEQANLLSLAKREYQILDKTKPNDSQVVKKLDSLGKVEGLPVTWRETNND